MNKQEFNHTQLEFIEHIKSVRNPYYWDTDEFLTTFKIVLNDAKREAIAEHEALQWKPYPDNRPEINKKCLITFMDGEVAIGAIWGKNAPWDENYVIAFRELPAPLPANRERRTEAMTYLWEDCKKKNTKECPFYGKTYVICNSCKKYEKGGGR